MIRVIAGVISGLVTWVVIATVVNLALRRGLTGYADVEVAMQFTLVMLVARLLLGVISSLAAGAAAAAIARSDPRATWLLAAALLLMFLPVHYKLWQVFPWWYHAVFLLSLAPAVFAGAHWVAHARGKRSDE